jgi:UDP-N-acetylglucosamine/UDP-N-acetylgalactosamine diphosphorylase
VEDSQLGPDVVLKSGYFRGAVFLNKSSAGSGAHVREGTIFEEEANIAHAVGLKQTILFPFVTLGSLINFCDCLMAGGTDRKNHSEVGSSYIHFNFTPNQDKATPSLIGDVPRGVMLNQPPIFLGGQGGLVGPCRLEYGTIVAAGTINRKDESRPGRLIFGGGGKGGNIPYSPGTYRSDKRIVSNNIIYIANLVALSQWYDHVRTMFIGPQFPQPLLEGMKEKLAMAIDERITRLGDLCLKLTDTVAITKDESNAHLQQKKELQTNWPEVEGFLQSNRSREGDTGVRDEFLNNINLLADRYGKDYISAIKGLRGQEAQLGSSWLQGIVDGLVKEAFNRIPSYQSISPTS